MQSGIGSINGRVPLECYIRALCVCFQPGSSGSKRFQWSEKHSSRLESMVVLEEHRHTQEQWNTLKRFLIS